MSETKALAIVPKSLDEVSTLAEVLAKSTLLPDALKGKVPDVVVSILAGQELGLAPMASIRSIHVVQGKPILSADGMVAVVLASGAAEYFSCIEDTDARVTYETKRRGSPKAQTSTWTIEDTKRAGLNTKDNWRMYTRAMMKARAKSALARDVYPDVLAGCFTEDEFEAPPRPVIDADDAEFTTAAQIERAEQPQPVNDNLDAALALINGAGSVESLKGEVSQQVADMKLVGAAKSQAESAYKTKLKSLRETPAVEPAA